MGVDTLIKLGIGLATFGVFLALVAVLPFVLPNEVFVSFGVLLQYLHLFDGWFPVSVLLSAFGFFLGAWVFALLLKLMILVVNAFEFVHIDYTPNIGRFGSVDTRREWGYRPNSAFSIKKKKN